MADVTSTANLVANVSVTGADQVEALKSSIEGLKGSATAAAGEIKSIQAAQVEGLKQPSEELLKLHRTSAEDWLKQYEWAGTSWVAKTKDDLLKEMQAAKAEPAAPELKAPAPPEISREAAIESKVQSIVATFSNMGDTALTAAAALGGVTLALGALYGAAKAIELLKSSFDWAQKSAADTQKIAGLAAQSGQSFDEAADNFTAGTALFGKGYQRAFGTVQKALTEKKFEKGLLEPLGFSEQDLAEVQREPLQIARKIAAQREKLSAEVAAAGTPEQAAAAKEAMDAFNLSMKQAFGSGPFAQQMGVLSTGLIDSFLEKAQQAREAARAQVPEIAPEQRVAEGQRLTAETFGIGALIQSMKDEIGVQATAGWADVAGKIRESLLSITPELTAIGTAITQKLQELLSGAAEGISTDTIKAKLAEFAQAIQGLDISAAVSGITEAFRTLSAVAGGVAGVISGIAAAFRQITEVGAAMGSILSAASSGDIKGLWQGFKDLGGALREEYKQVKEVAPEAAKPAEPPATFAERFAPAEVPVKPDLSEIQSAIAATEIKAPDLSAAGAAGGEALGSAANSGITTAGSSGGQAFSTAASSGLTSAGQAAGSAFAGAVNPSSIGQQIGAAAASAISAAKVNVNVNVAGGTAGGASTGKDSAT